MNARPMATQPNHQDEQRAYNEGWNKVTQAYCDGYHAPRGINPYDSDDEALRQAWADGFDEGVANCQRMASQVRP